MYVMLREQDRECQAMTKDSVAPADRAIMLVEYPGVAKS